MHLISLKMQMLLILMANNRFISFRSQKIYENQRSFNMAINKLIKLDWINKRPKLFTSNNEYFLTLRGEIVARVFIEFAEK